MKYIRTKDGRVFIPNKVAHEPIGINGEWKAVACWYHGEPFDMEKEISEFKRCTEKVCIYSECHKYMHCLKSLTSAPQSWYYVEV